MRNLAILGAQARSTFSLSGPVDELMLNGSPVCCAIVETAEPAFDPDLPENRSMVLVRVKAFSLNYRDKNRIFTMCAHGAGNGFYVIGSDFVAEVVAAGPAVTRVAPGDRVIGDNSYPSSGCENVRPGVVSNHGSREFQVLHEAKLMRAIA